MNKEEIKEFIIERLKDKKAEDIIVYSREEFNISSDYVFISSGRSTKNVCAIAENLSLELKKLCISSAIEGMARGEWVLADCGNIIVHIFHPETRAYYNLEELYNSTIITKK